LQVNGKVRGKINVPAQADEAQLREWALSNEPCWATLKASRCAR